MIGSPEIFGNFEAAITTLATLIALFVSWLDWRRRELRREEVLIWANQSITELQSLFLLCQDDLNGRSASSANFDEIRLNTSILVEQGRLFFKNARPKEYGQSKELAYRGYRPLILDQLVYAHQIADKWNESAVSERTILRNAAGVCLKKFVSLAQSEVGRSRTVSQYTRVSGDGGDVFWMMAQRDISKVGIDRR